MSIVPVAHVDAKARATLDAARSVQSGEVVAVHVCDPKRRAESRRFQREWIEWDADVTMVLLYGREESIGAPIREYVRQHHGGSKVYVFVSHHETSRPHGPGAHHARQLEEAFSGVPRTVVCERSALP